MHDLIELFSKAWPYVAGLMFISGFLGWSLRGPGAPSKPAKAGPVADKGSSERVKRLEAALETAKSSHKSAQSELLSFQSGSVTRAELEGRIAELEAAHQSLATESKRTAALEVELKKSQDTIRKLNTRVNETDKQQKDSRFALENELSKAREQLALLQNRPDDSAELHTEIGRLRESVATTTRFAGELRKREATAVEELEKLRAKLTGPGDSHAPVAPQKPPGDSDRVAAAKAEVLRLLEKNQQRQEAADKVDG